MTSIARMDAPARWAIILVVALAFVAAVASAASAQSGLLDPKTIVDPTLYQRWATTATGWAHHIYLTLLVFELIALAITTLLFRENIGEFFASFGLKVFIGGVYFWFIDNVATGVAWPKAIIDTFKSFGLQLGGTDGTDWLTVQGLGAAVAYAAAGAKAQFLGSQAATLANVPPNCLWGVGGEGYCNQGIVTSVALESVPFAMMMYGMSLMIVMAIAAIYLQIILMTIESYMVVGAGVLFIGFAGSRFTMPFSAGYFSYMFNVGVKFMVLYIVLGIEQAFMPTILGTAITALLLTTPYTEYLAFVPAAVGLVNVVIAAGLVWTIPGFAGSFLSGQSAASGSAVLGQAIGAISSASGMMAQFHQAANVANAAHSSSASLQPVHASNTTMPNGGNGAGHSIQQQPMSPTPRVQSPPQSSPATGTGFAVGGMQGTSGLGSWQMPAQNGQQTPEMLRAYALASLAQGAPRDIGQPSAVQVRPANPDKL